MEIGIAVIVVVILGLLVIKALGHSMDTQRSSPSRKATKGHGWDVDKGWHISGSRWDPNTRSKR